MDKMDTEKRQHIQREDMQNVERYNYNELLLLTESTYKTATQMLVQPNEQHRQRGLHNLLREIERTADAALRDIMRRCGVHYTTVNDWAEQYHRKRGNKYTENEREFWSKQRQPNVVTVDDMAAMSNTTYIQNAGNDRDVKKAVEQCKNIPKFSDNKARAAQYVLLYAAIKCEYVQLSQMLDKVGAMDRETAYNAILQTDELFSKGGNVLLPDESYCVADNLAYIQREIRANTDKGMAVAFIETLSKHYDAMLRRLKQWAGVPHLPNYPQQFVAVYDDIKTFAAVASMLPLDTPATYTATVAQTPTAAVEARVKQETPPAELLTQAAQTLFEKAEQAGFCTRLESGCYKWNKTKSLCAYFVMRASDKLDLKANKDATSWTPFEQLFTIRGLASCKNEWTNKTGTPPKGYKDVDK